MNDLTPNESAEFERQLQNFLDEPNIKTAEVFAPLLEKNKEVTNSFLLRLQNYRYLILKNDIAPNTYCKSWWSCLFSSSLNPKLYLKYHSAVADYFSSQCALLWET